MRGAQSLFSDTLGRKGPYLICWPPIDQTSHICHTSNRDVENERCYRVTQNYRFEPPGTSQVPGEHQRREQMHESWAPLTGLVAGKRYCYFTVREGGLKIAGGRWTLPGFVGIVASPAAIKARCWFRPRDLCYATWFFFKLLTYRGWKIQFSDPKGL